VLAGGAPQGLHREGPPLVWRWGNRDTTHPTPAVRGASGRGCAAPCRKSRWRGVELRRGSLLADWCMNSPPSHRPLLQIPSTPISEPSGEEAARAFGPQTDPALLRHPTVPPHPALKQAKVPAGLRTCWCLQSCKMDIVTPLLPVGTGRR